MKLKNLIYSFLSFSNYYYFPKVLTRNTWVPFSPSYKVNFNLKESNFLQESANTYITSEIYAAGYIQKAIGFYKMHKVIFLGNSGALVQNNKVITESVFDQVRLAVSPAYRSPAFMWNQRKKGLFTSILHLPWAHRSNYHWFYDCLPRLYALVQTIQEPIKVIINQDIAAFQLETLRFILQGNPYFELVSIHQNQKWELENFILPAFITNSSSGYLPEPVLSFIQKQIWQGYNVEIKLISSRIYISRSKATKRRILNEKALLPILKQYGFEIIFAEDLSYQQQVQLFYNAEIVVSPHGAGLSNILFSRRCKVLELHPADLIKPHYFFAAKSLGIPYYYLIGGASNDYLDFTVDVYSLNVMLNEIFNTK